MLTDAYGEHFGEFLIGWWKDGIHIAGAVVDCDTTIVNGTLGAFGQGWVYDSNGNIYTGELSHRVIEGEGTMRYENGASYTGDWVNGKRHGRGEYTYTNGDTEVGEYKHNKKRDEHIYMYQASRIQEKRRYNSRGIQFNQ